MAIFKVRAWAVDWCGYEDIFTIEAENEDEALEKAIYELAELYDLISDGEGNYVDLHDSDSWDEDGELLETADVTAISSRIERE